MSAEAMSGRFTTDKPNVVEFQDPHECLELRGWANKIARKVGAASMLATAAAATEEEKARGQKRMEELVKRVQAVRGMTPLRNPFFVSWTCGHRHKKDCSSCLGWVCPKCATVKDGRRLCPICAEQEAAA